MIRPHLASWVPTLRLLHAPYSEAPLKMRDAYFSPLSRPSRVLTSVHVGGQTVKVRTGVVTMQKVAKVGSTLGDVVPSQRHDDLLYDLCNVSKVFPIAFLHSFLTF